MASPADRPLWTCPECGHRFSTAHTWHSCSTHDLEEHFAGRPPALRATFDRCLATLAEVGPVTVIAQRSRIVMMVRVRCCGAVVRTRWIDCSIALRREVTHPLLRSATWYGRRWCAHTFRLTSPDDVDPAIQEWLRESYAVGAQRD